MVKRLVKNVLFNSFIAETLKRVKLFEDGINIPTSRNCALFFFAPIDGIVLSEELGSNGKKQIMINRNFASCDTSSEKHPKSLSL